MILNKTLYFSPLAPFDTVEPQSPSPDCVSSSLRWVSFEMRRSQADLIARYTSELASERLYSNNSGIVRTEDIEWPDKLELC